MRNKLTNETNMVFSNTDPTVNNDASEGYRPGSFWVNQTGEDVFTCLDATVGAAKWLSQKLGTIVGA